MACEAKHVKFEPPAEEWNCPKCGAEVGTFAIYDPAEGADPDCPFTHNDDFIRCEGCGFETSGRAFSNRIKKKLNMVVCPTCKGAGHIHGGNQ